MEIQVQSITFEEKAAYTKEIVNMTISKRKANMRDDLTQIMIAGRYLSELREMYPYTEWYHWLDENVQYHENPDTNRRYAQKDMQFWKTLSPFVLQMQEMGIIQNMDSPEREFIDSLSDKHVEIAKSTLNVLTQTNVSELGRKIFFDIIADKKDSGAIFTEKHTRKLVEAVESVEHLEKEEHKSIALDLIVNHDLTNKAIVEQIPNIDKNYPDVLEEIKNTGKISIMDEESEEIKAIPISEISVSELNKALKKENDEQEARDRIKDVPLEKMDTVWLRNIHGTAPEILLELEKALKYFEKNKRFKISLHIVKEDREEIE